LPKVFINKQLNLGFEVLCYAIFEYMGFCICAAQWVGGPCSS